MRFLTAILFIVLLLMQSVGTHVVFQVKRNLIRKEIKHEIKRGVPEKELVTIDLPKSPSTANFFSWIDDNEIRYKGKMYDVVRKVNRTPDSVRLYCIADHQEDELFASLDVLVNKVWSTDNQRNKNELLTLAIGSDYIHGRMLPFAGTPSLLLYKSKAINHSYPLLRWYPSTPTPPPQNFI